MANEQVTSKRQIAFQPNDNERALFEQIKDDLGTRNNAEVLRIAVRTLAEQRGLLPTKRLAPKQTHSAAPKTIDAGIGVVHMSRKTRASIAQIARDAALKYADFLTDDEVKRLTRDIQAACVQAIDAKVCQLDLEMQELLHRATGLEDRLRRAEKDAPSEVTSPTELKAWKAPLIKELDQVRYRYRQLRSQRRELNKQQHNKEHCNL